MDDLLADFLTETHESLAELDLALVKLEQDPQDAGTLALIFRMVHTIKGTCGFLGLSRLEKVAHAGENVLGKVRDGVLIVTPDMVTTVLAALDRIKLIIAGIATTGQEPKGDDLALIAMLDAISEGRKKEAEPPLLETHPIEAHPIEAHPIETHPIEAGTPDAQVAGQTIRVGLDVLENLMTLVSELVLTRNQLLQVARNQADSGFTPPLQRLSQITSDLQEGVMKTRMQPIGHAWNKLPRLVRDLARELDKRIELVMLGADTELDRQVLELIKDPLTHMVRNSGDHGLEGPAERRAAGKAETGRIALNAYHEGGHIVIEIADDGRGLPVERIREKVLSKGLASDAELAAMSDEAIQRFIFRAGFSTAAAVTAVSGRGVGMDVVKTNIERIGGTIDLKSTAGHGTVFTIKIPLTLAIVSALIVEAASERFAIPQISVVELVRAHANARAATNGQGEATSSVIERINDTPVLRLRERLLPLIHLDELLHLGRPASATANDGFLTIVVAQVGASQLGIIVDRVFDTEEIVVKPVAPVLRHVSMFSGNTILGDGSVIMILDPSGIARATGVGGAGSQERSGQPEPTDTGVIHEPTDMLLFRAGSTQVKAVPLSLLARIENIPADRIEFAAGSPVTQYRGRLMPLIPMTGSIDTGRSHQAVLVFADSSTGQGRERCMGLVVDEIVDVVADHLRIQLNGGEQGVLGTSVIAGRATDVIDTAFWLTQAHADWFQAPQASNSNTGRVGHRQDGSGPHVLVVEDSDFFRHMIVPVLQAAGYEVAAVADAAQALALRDRGVMFDAIVSDIEMPDMDGIAFVSALRSSGSWSELPVIALSGHANDGHVDSARRAGFTDYVAKFAKEALLESLQQCLAEPGPNPALQLRQVA